jgi:hypothetical protein
MVISFTLAPRPPQTIHVAWRKPYTPSHQGRHERKTDTAASTTLKS